jgi:hypothetical protein
MSDDDYDPTKQIHSKSTGNKKSTAKPKAKRVPAKKRFLVTDSFLDQHGNEIKEMYQAGDKNKDIASFLSSKYLKGLNDRALEPKSIENWIDYRVRSGQFKKRKSALNAESTDWYADANIIAKEDGKPFLEEDSIENETEETWSGTEEVESAMKYSRFFTKVEEETNKFVIFCETGLDREFTCTIAHENVISVRLQIPLPEDGLLQAVGLHAVNNTLQAVDEYFAFQSPRKLVLNPPPTKVFYPSAEKPIWTAFVFALEKQEAIELVQLSFKSNLMKELMK